MEILTQKNALAHRSVNPGLMSPFVTMRSQPQKAKTGKGNDPFAELQQWSERMGNLTEVLPWLE